MYRLINISNHPSSEWTEQQKFGWDEIVDIPFPQIDPKDSVWTVEEQAQRLFKEILKQGWTDNGIRVAIQGEYTLCYILMGLIYRWNGALEPPIQVFVPVFEEKVVEKVQLDGSLKKVVISKFVRWREI